MTFKSNWRDWCPAELRVDRSTLDRNNFVGAVQGHGRPTDGTAARTKFATVMVARGFDHKTFEGFRVETHLGVWSEHRSERGKWAKNPQKVRDVLRIAFPGMFKQSRDFRRLVVGVGRLTAQQAKAYRWLVVIHGYFRDGLACRDIAADSANGMTRRQVEAIVRTISKILKGRAVNGLQRKRRGRPARKVNSCVFPALSMERKTTT